MAEIAAAAGVCQGLAYRYLPSKDALLTRLVEEGARAGGGPAMRVREIEGSPGERLDLLISYVLKARQERPEFFQSLYQVLADDAVAPELRAVVRRNGNVIQEGIWRLIVEGQATGEVANGRSRPADGGANDGIRWRRPARPFGGFKGPESMISLDG